MHPLFTTLMAVTVVALVALGTQLLLHIRSRREESELSTAWLDLDGTARRHRWMG